MLEIIDRFIENASVPIIANPNAGLPVVAYSSQAKGFFSKQISGEELKLSGKKSYLSLNENFRRFERIKGLFRYTGI